jgi:hypothetical protein
LAERRGNISDPLAISVQAVIEAAMSAGHLPKGGVYGAIEMPDPVNGACCIGSAAMGPQYCTCWEPVYDLEQHDITPGKPASARSTLCGDCAYRPGSPERSGDERYIGDPEFLAQIAQTGDIFWCHQGLRRVVKLRHPSGAEVVIETDHYDPPKDGGVPFKADGTPGDICAGWSAHRARHLKRAAPAARGPAGVTCG